MGISLDELVDITINNGAGASAVNIQDGGNSITVDAINLDIRDLAFATDKVDVSGSEVSLSSASLSALENITVSATDLDIRDLTHASDSVKIGDGTDFLAINNDGSINANFTPTAYAAMKNSVETVTTTAAQVLATPLAGRREVTIQNEGSADVYLGHNASVTSANGIKLSKNSSATYLIPAAVDIYMVASSGSQSVRFLELG